jgi:hypothetical protein
MLYNPIEPHSMVVGTAKSFETFRDDGLPEFYYWKSRKIFWYAMPFTKENGAPYEPTEWDQFVKDTGIGFGELTMDYHFRDQNREDESLEILKEKLPEFLDKARKQTKLERIGLNGLVAAGRFFTALYENNYGVKDLRSITSRRYYNNYIAPGKGEKKFGLVLPAKNSQLHFDVWVLPSNSPTARAHYDQSQWDAFWDACTP